MREAKKLPHVIGRTPLEAALAPTSDIFYQASTPLLRLLIVSVLAMYAANAADSNRVLLQHRCRVMRQRCRMLELPVSGVMSLRE